MDTPKSDSESRVKAVLNDDLLAHCWRATFKSGETMEIAREILCKPIPRKEAMDVASAEGEVMTLEPLGLKNSAFWG